MTGLVFPLPREYWIDGARIQFNPKERWEPAGPFKPWPSNYANGVALSDSNAAILRRQLHPVVTEWLERHSPCMTIKRRTGAERVLAERSAIACSARRSTCGTPLPSRLTAPEGPRGGITSIGPPGTTIRRAGSVD